MEDPTTTNTNPASTNRQETIDRLGAMLEAHEAKQLEFPVIEDDKIRKYADSVVRQYPQYLVTDDIVVELTYQHFRAQTITRTLVADVLRERKMPTVKGTIRKLSDIKALTIDRPRWIVESCIRAGTLNAIVGASKAGKSRVALEVVESVLTGRPFLDKYEAVVKGPVWLMTSDDDEEELHRVTQEWAYHRDIPEDAPLGQFFHYPLNLANHGEVRRFIDQINGVPDHEKPVMIVLDSVYNFMPEADDNERAQMKQVFSVFLRQICNETGVALLCIEHAAKMQGEGANSVIGSQAKGAAYRSGITATVVEKDYKDESTGNWGAKVKLSRWGNAGRQWDGTYIHFGETFEWRETESEEGQGDYQLIKRAFDAVESGEPLMVKDLGDNRSQRDKAEAKLAATGFRIETIPGKPGKPKGVVGYTMEHKVVETLRQHEEMAARGFGEVSIS